MGVIQLSVGNNIKNLRKQAGFSQKELAAMIEQTPTSIMHYEKGDRTPNQEIIEKIATALKVRPSTLLDWDDWENSNFRETIGMNIKTVRKSRKMTQEQLAQKIGKHESSIRKYEKGLTDIPNEVIIKIADVLEVSPAELLSVDEWESKFNSYKNLADYSTEELLAEIERRCVKMTIGQNIKVIRKEKGITQKKLSELTGLAEITIRQYEADKFTPKIQQVEKIASALNVKPYIICGWEGSEVMNKNKFVSVMKLHGDTQESLAEAIGLSVQRMNAKINSTGGAEFTMSEIRAIKIRYDLTGEDIDEIFFCD